MMNLISRFAAETGPIVHVSPGSVGNIAGFNITNSIIYGWVCAIVISILMIVIARRITVKPKAGLIQVVEVGVDFISNLVENAFENKAIGRKYVPYFVTLFFFILLIIGWGSCLSSARASNLATLRYSDRLLVILTRL